MSWLPAGEAAALGTLLQVVLIDLTLAGDNAIVVGMAAAGLPAAQRRRVILIGIGAATVLRILFALIAVKLLVVIGLTLAGGLLLLWVAWKSFREAMAQRSEKREAGAGAAVTVQSTSYRKALVRIVIADVSMSLDNVLAVAGTARDHMAVLAMGLVLSVGLMGAASNAVAKLLHRMPWLVWLGLAIVAYVALDMIWDGSLEVHRRLME